jgi:YVTN family beta-propeller protein
MSKFSWMRLGVLEVVRRAVPRCTRQAALGLGLKFIPVHVSFSPDGLHAYVLDAGSNSVSGIDTCTSSLSTTVRLEFTGQGRLFLRQPARTPVCGARVQIRSMTPNGERSVA